MLLYYAVLFLYINIYNCFIRQGYSLQTKMQFMESISCDI